MNNEVQRVGNAPASVPRLKRGSLTHTDALGQGLATIAPAFSLLMALPLIVAGAGLGSPIVVLLAGIGVLFHVNTTAEFSKVMPSAGTYVAFLGRSWGQKAGGSAAMLIMLAYCGIMSSILLVPGIWTAQLFNDLFGVNMPWWIPFLVLDILVGVLIYVGVQLSTRVAIALFLFELLVLIVAGVAMVSANPSAVSFAAFNPGNIAGGFQGFALAFPLAVYMFGGSSNMAPLAEEIEAPRRSIPAATFMTVYAGIIIYVLITWATIVGFHGDVDSLSKAAIPLLDASQKPLGKAIFLIYLGGFTSTLALAISAMNGYVRVGFNCAREGMFPRALTRVSRYHTPWAALLAFMGTWFLIALVAGATMGAMNAFQLLSSLGMLLYILVYVATNVALPVLYLREFRSKFSVLKHVAFPVLGTAAFILPLLGFFAPGQPAPYNYFPLMALIIVLVSIVIGSLRSRANPQMCIGTIIADQRDD